MLSTINSLLLEHINIEIDVQCIMVCFITGFDKSIYLKVSNFYGVIFVNIDITTVRYNTCSINIIQFAPC